MNEKDFGNVAYSMFRPITPSSISSAKEYNNFLYSERFMTLGVVSNVLPPSHKENRTKTQYEYLVTVTAELNSHRVLRCILYDGFGGINDYSTFTLKTGQRVAVLCVQGNPDSGLIISCIQNTKTATSEALGHHLISRFNNITSSITKDNVHYVKHDDGNEIRIEPTKIIAKDGAGNQITIDKAAKKIIITDGSGDTITIDKNSKKITIQAKDLNLEVKGNLKANVKGKADIKAKTINLNGSSGKVVTTKTHKVDFVTGIPIKGVGKVKAG